jgi:predicted outer membrane repeat protein
LEADDLPATPRVAAALAGCDHEMVARSLVCVDSRCALSGPFADQIDANRGAGAPEHWTAGALTMTDDRVSNDTADSDGGAVYADEDATITVANSTFDQDSNDDSDGGAIYDDESGPMTVTGATFDGDSAGSSDGGAIDADGGHSSPTLAGTFSVTGSTFDGDVAGEEDVPDGVELRWRSGCDVTTLRRR